jgi:hypothetical protein
MQIIFSSKYQMNPRELLRRCGYGELVKTKKSSNTRIIPVSKTSGPISLRDKLQSAQGETSYIRRMTNGEFPRFHAYIGVKPDGFQVNLHLDQKAPTYGENTAHNGEYDGETVELEGKRLKEIIDSLAL